MQEIWKDIQGYEGKYQVSNLGNVKVIKEWIGNRYCSKYKTCNKLLKPIKDSAGYYCVSLWKGAKSKTHRIHVEVAKAFVSNSNNYPVINHIDGNKTNNCINNLEWCTYKHNSIEAIRLGLNNPSNNLKRWNGKFGKDHNRSKAIYQIDNNTNEILNKFYGIAEASRKTGINSTSISNCCHHRILCKNNKKWMVKTAGGFKWEFVNK